MSWGASSASGAASATLSLGLSVLFVLVMVAALCMLVVRRSRRAIKMVEEGEDRAGRWVEMRDMHGEGEGGVQEEEEPAGGR